METPPAVLPAPAALRELRRAFAHVADFTRFTETLERALGAAGFFADASIQLFDTETPAGVFRPGRLALPLAGAGRLHGVLQLAGPAGTPRLGAEDLHLMTALAGVLAAALDHAVRHGEQQRDLELLAFLLDLAPVGIVAVHPGGRVAVANELARRWLGAEFGDAAALAARLAPERLGVDWRVQPRFHLRVDGKLIYGEARSCAGATGQPGASALVLVDLTAQQAQLLDGLQRELYRCRWLGLKLTFVLLESRVQTAGWLQGLPEIRAQLQPGELAGPYDAFRAGLVLPGLDRAGALARLRTLAPVLPATGLHMAVVVAADPVAVRVLHTAIGSMQPVEGLLRRTLLLHDDYPAVNDMIERVLHRGYDVVKSSHYAETEGLLRTRAFDGLVTEVELREGGGLELARLARQLQPRIRPFFTTMAHDVPGASADPALAGHVVIRKPFDIGGLEAAVRSALG